MTRKLLAVNYRFCMSIQILLMLAIPESLSYIVPQQQIYRQRGAGDRQAKLSLADWSSYNYREPEGPGTYAFGYDVDDAETGNTQFREEERHPNGTVTGSYGYVDPFGKAQIVHYIADERGYRVRMETGRKKSRGIVKTFPQQTMYPGNVPITRAYSNDQRQLSSPQNTYYVNPVYESPQQPYYSQNNYIN